MENGRNSTRAATAHPVARFNATGGRHEQVLQSRVVPNEGMFEYMRSGRSGLLFHAIGSPATINDLLNGNQGRIEWLDPTSVNEGGYHVLADCTVWGQDDQGTPISDDWCMGAALLHEELFPVVFNFPWQGDQSADIQNMHPIGLLFDPDQMTSQNYVSRMFVVDGDTIKPDRNYWRCDAGRWQCASGVECSAEDITADQGGGAMDLQCDFDASQWSEFFGERIAFQEQQYGYPQAGAYLETEVNLKVGEDMFNQLIHNALQAVVVQTNSCGQQLDDDSKCGDWNAENDVIVLAKQTACRVALDLFRQRGGPQGSGPVPVYYADFATNSFVSKAWVASDPTGYMFPLDCCNEDLGDRDADQDTAWGCS